MDIIGDFQRIAQIPGVMGGKPCIRGTRVTVARVVSQIGTGQSVESLLEDYPHLDLEDVLEALRYAAWLTEGHEVEIVQA
jgi:uncharacterized protein (DUF433 family)